MVISPEQTRELIERITQLFADTEQIAQSVRDDADAGRFDGEPGPQGPPGPKGEPGEPGTSDYTELSNKPSINDTVLEGNVSIREVPESTVEDSGKFLGVNEEGGVEWMDVQTDADYDNLVGLIVGGDE